jgi:hypothetical protein
MIHPACCGAVAFEVYGDSVFSAQHQVCGIRPSANSKRLRLSPDGVCVH